MENFAIKALAAPLRGRVKPKLGVFAMDYAVLQIRDEATYLGPEGERLMWKAYIALYTALLALLAVNEAAVAQPVGSGVEFPGGYAPGQSPCIRQGDGACIPVSIDMPLPIAQKQEAVQLVSGNMAAVATMVHGGVYVFSQTCSGYNNGPLALRYRGPDGATMLTMLTKTASDSSGGTLVSLGSNAVMDVTLPSGSIACNAMLARIP